MLRGYHRYEFRYDASGDSRFQVEMFGRCAIREVAVGGCSWTAAFSHLLPI